MQQIVSITSQGQVTIPAKMRRELGLEDYKKASVKTERGKIVIEPIPDLLNLAGSLENRSIKGKRIDEIIKLEKSAIARAIVGKKKTLKQ